MTDGCATELRAVEGHLCNLVQAIRKLDFTVKYLDLSRSELHNQLFLLFLLLKQYDFEKGIVQQHPIRMEQTA